MKISFDQTTDFSFRELNAFMKKASFTPDYVKEASVDCKSDVEHLPKEAFADEGNRVFPKNTKSRTYLSSVYFLNKKAALKEKYNDYYVNSVEKKLKEAAQIFDIEEDINKYASALLEKESQDYSVKAIFEKEIDGNVISLFNFKTAADIKVAADQFAKDYKKIPFDWRFEISNNFVKAAKEMEIDELPDIICKYAGLFYANPSHVKTELNRRALRNPNVEHKEVYNKLASLVDEYDSVEDFMKTAFICHDMEEMQGIYLNYKTASLFGDPIDQIFNLPVEKLAETLDVIKLGNHYFKVKDLQEVKPEIYKQAFGADINVKDAEELREVLPTMPLDDVNLFRELSSIKAV